MLEFVRENFIDPVVNREPYNPYNTAVYVVLFLALVEIYWKIFASKQNQKDLRYSALPFAFFAGFLRFLDGRLFPSTLLTITPGIFLLVTAIFTSSYIVIGKRKTFVLGVILSAVSMLASLLYLNFSRWQYAIAALVVFYLLYMVYSRVPFMEDRFAWAPHIFEAWVTGFGVMAGLMEEHVIANALMGQNPLLFSAVKSIVLLVIMFLIKDVEKEQRAYVGTVIGVLGLGPGIRDLLELLSL